MTQALLSGRDLLQIRDAAKLLGVSEKTLRNWDRAGHLRAHRHPINGYRLYRVADLHTLLGQYSDSLDEMPAVSTVVEEQLSLGFTTLPAPEVNESTVDAESGSDLLPCHWTRQVALDPKHRPQKWNAPSTTVRRDWRKFPQEAHVLDSEERRYRRLKDVEIAIIQGFEPAVIDLPSLTERQRIAALGDSVPPPLAIALVRGITQEYSLRKRTAIEICAGAGGLAEGAAKAGLDHLLLIDASPSCASLLRHQRSWSPDIVINDDVRTFDFSRFRGKVGLLSGGPPCQPWSQSGQHGGEEDERDLLGHMPDLVAILRPEVFLFENVPGLAMFDEGRYLRELVQRLRNPTAKASYGVLVAVLNAADFGVPQIRKRVFILGIRDQSGSFASRCFDAVMRLQTHRDPALTNANRPSWKTIGDAFGSRKDPGGWRRWIGGGIG
jgi:site-specific DNA-cytosine methylase